MYKFSSKKKAQEFARRMSRQGKFALVQGRGVYVA